MFRYPGFVSKSFRTCDLDQPFLLPPSLQDWLPEEHLARFIADLAMGLDHSMIYSGYERRDGRGKAAYHPLNDGADTALRLLPRHQEFAADGALHLRRPCVSIPVGGPASGSRYDCRLSPAAPAGT